jgi:hypothetical protein
LQAASKVSPIRSGNVDSTAEEIRRQVHHQLALVVAMVVGIEQERVRGSEITLYLDCYYNVISHEAMDESFPLIYQIPSNGLGLKPTKETSRFLENLETLTGVDRVQSFFWCPEGYEDIQ